MHLICAAVAMASVAGTPVTLLGKTDITVMGVRGEGAPLAALQAFLTARKHVLNGCYEDRLVTDPSTTGTMRLAFTVNPQGRAESVVTESKLPFIGDCVASVVRNLAFPFRPEAPVKVETEVTFEKATKETPPPAPSLPASLRPATGSDPFAKLKVSARGRVDIRVERVGAQDVRAADLERFIRSRKAALLGCFEKELARRPGLNGQLNLAFTLTQAGRVGNIKADNLPLGVAPQLVRAMVPRWS